VSGSSSGDRTAGFADSNVKKLSARCGSTFRIDLWEDRTRGELWVPAYDPAVLVLTDEEFDRVATGNAADIGQRSFEFRAVAPGTHHIVFEKRLGWKFTAEDRRVFSIDVTDGNRCLPVDGL
jgi:predicted secreted protein